MKKTSNLWIARDKDGFLRIFRYKPERYDNSYFDTPGFPFITIYIAPISNELYPEVTWENSPKELIINN